ncbi:MAG: alginate export family protein [Pseudomonadota bacterium]|nr:alginate export family protein [Pseudomonadota bacterium]
MTRFLVFAVLACTGLARAAEKAPEYQKLRYGEDYGYLRSPDARRDFFDPIKYIPISSDGAAYLSLGGLLRERYEYQSNPLWGDGSQDRSGVFLQRYMLHADLHLSAHGRAFAQFQSALASGRRGGPSPVDEDELDLHQAFADIALGIGGTLALTLRAGRQEMAYGSARLIDVRQGPNVRRSFDAARVLLHAGGWQVDGFAARPVLSGGGVFDSRRDPNQALWGVYGSGKPSGLRGAALDLYCLSLNDGLYSPAGALIRGAGGSRARYVGSAVSLAADWQITRHLNLTTIYAHAFPGQFIRDTGPAESIDFIETTFTLTF